jgi:hypothetical protein
MDLPIQLLKMEVLLILEILHERLLKQRLRIVHPVHLEVVELKVQLLHQRVVQISSRLASLLFVKKQGFAQIHYLMDHLHSLLISHMQVVSHILIKL